MLSKRELMPYQSFLLYVQEYPRPGSCPDANDNSGLVFDSGLSGVERSKHEGDNSLELTGASTDSMTSGPVKS